MLRNVCVETGIVVGNRSTAWGPFEGNWERSRVEESTAPERIIGEAGGGTGARPRRMLHVDVCLNVWDDVDPKHFTKPGGKIE